MNGLINVGIIHVQIYWLCFSNAPFPNSTSRWIQPKAVNVHCLAWWVYFLAPETYITSPFQTVDDVIRCRWAIVCQYLLSYFFFLGYKAIELCPLLLSWRLALRDLILSSVDLVVLTLLSKPLYLIFDL